MLNHRTFFTPDNKVQYLSGQPLYVITLTLTDVFRQSVGPHVPISFSAGIDQGNFAARRRLRFRAGHRQQRSAASRRLRPHLDLSESARPVDAEGRRQKRQRLHPESVRPGGAAYDKAASDPHDKSPDSAVRWASLMNTTIAAEKARKDPRYRADKNRKEPTRIDSHLVTFDCITCDKCLPVCPNAANFTYPTPIVAFDYQDLVVDSKGAVREGSTEAFRDQRKNADRLLLRFLQRVRQLRHLLPRVRRPVHQKAHLLRQPRKPGKKPPRATALFCSATKTRPASTAA